VSFERDFCAAVIKVIDSTIENQSSVTEPTEANAKKQED
jgi:hypothetical protein